jgi:hypothetical protein
MEIVTLSLTDADQKAFQQVLDLALRNNGMGAFSIVSHFVALVSQATQQAAAAQAQVKISAAPATPVAQVSHAAAESSTEPAAQPVTHPAASQPQQPAQHGGGILGTIESALGLGQQHPTNQTAASQHHPATLTSAPAAAPAPAAATVTPATQTRPGHSAATPAAAAVTAKATSAPAATPATATATAQTPTAQATGNTSAVS